MQVFGVKDSTALTALLLLYLSFRAHLATVKRRQRCRGAAAEQAEVCACWWLLFAASEIPYRFPRSFPAADPLASRYAEKIKGKDETGRLGLGATWQGRPRGAYSSSSCWPGGVHAGIDRLDLCPIFEE